MGCPTTAVPLDVGSDADQGLPSLAPGTDASRGLPVIAERRLTATFCPFY